MAGRNNQKIKLLYVMSILLEQTDAEHGISMKEILMELERYGIIAERKSIYDDIEALRFYGMDIEYVSCGKSGNYRIMNREFELPEVKLLVDAVQASKFITKERSNELIKKLENLSSKHIAAKLQRQVYVAERVKTSNTSVYYSVDAIHEAISENKQISFVYMQWDLNRKLTPKNDGKLYKISPWALTWMDENYYLLGYDNERKQIRHYRVDKMKQVQMSEEKREGKEAFQNVDLAKYSKKHFGMFHGEEMKVKLRCKNELVGAVLDRFGSEVSIRKDGDSHFIVNVDVALSPQFYGWIFALGSEVQVVEPKEATEGMKEHLQKVISQY